MDLRIERGRDAPAHAPVLTAVLALEDVRPEVFLRSFPGEARGFWARDHRWVAHAGALATLAVEGDGDRERFRRIAGEAAGWIDRSRVLAGRAAREEARLRFYGGFSFRDDHRASGFWEAFPAALFLLPAVELEGEGGGVSRLRARTLLSPEADPAAAAGELEDWLERLAGRIREEPAAPVRPVSPAASSVSPGPGSPAASHVVGARTETGRVTWDDGVEEALDAIRRGRFRKVVLARTMDVTTGDPLDPVELLGHLWRQNPGTHVFLFEPKPGRALLGAAPETVATVKRGAFQATAVAGSIARGSGDTEQRELARRLLASEKDRDEHRIALEDMLARLGRVAEGVEAAAEPHVLTLARIQHLETEIHARVPERSVLDLLEVLHPTPAVCGLPRDAALEFLRSEESFERGWYAGPVGFFDEDGGGVFAPALRSAVAHGRTWRLFAGAGIVAGSRPELEWEETRIKFEPILEAFEASGARIADGAPDPASPEPGEPPSAPA